MELCKRCKINKIDLQLNKSGQKYCTLCDYYVQNIMNNETNNNNTMKNNKVNKNNKSKLSKNNLKENINKNFLDNKEIQNKQIEENIYNKNNEQENNFYMNNTNYEYQNLYQKESKEILNKINQLKSLDKFTFNLDDYNNINQNLYLSNSYETNQNPLQNISTNYNDITNLQKIIEEQREKINELKLEQNNLKSIINQKDLLIKKLKNEKEEVIKNCEEEILKLKGNDNIDKNDFDNLKIIKEKLENDIKTKDKEKSDLIQENQKYINDIEILKKENEKIKKELNININENEILKEIIGNNMKNNEAKKFNQIKDNKKITKNKK